MEVGLLVNPAGDPLAIVANPSNRAGLKRQDPASQ